MYNQFNTYNKKRLKQKNKLLKNNQATFKYHNKSVDKN